MKEYLISGNWGGTHALETIIVYTRKDKELISIFEDENGNSRDWEDEDVEKVNDVLKRISPTLTDENVFCYVELKDEDNIKTLKEELKKSWDFQVNIIETWVQGNLVPLQNQ